jgi:hypothetical protein
VYGGPAVKEFCGGGGTGMCRSGSTPAEMGRAGQGGRSAGVMEAGAALRRLAGDRRRWGRRQKHGGSARSFRSVAVWLCRGRFGEVEPYPKTVYAYPNIGRRC